MSELIPKIIKVEKKKKSKNFKFYFKRVINHFLTDFNLDTNALIDFLIQHIII